MDESRANKLRDIDILTGSATSNADANSGVDGNGEPLFVINLCAAMTPIDLDSQGFTGLEKYKLYQVSRMEDGRRRYRLRLGFFTTVALAEDVLSSVRGRYATAFTSCLCEEDLKHATGYLKCSVQDLQRTGRYAVQRLRRDTGSTTALRVLTPAMIANLRAAEQPAEETVQKSPAAKPQAGKAVLSPIKTSHPIQQSREDFVDLCWQTDLRAVPKGPPPKQSIAQPTAVQQPKAAKTSQAAPTKTPPRTVGDTLAARIEALKAEAPRRESLMRRAQAMAPSDAADRAKVVPSNTTRDVDTAATGRFKLPIIAPPRVVLEASAPPLHTPKPSVRNNNQPFHVGAGAEIPDTSLSLAPQEPIVTRATSSVTRVAPIVAPIADTSTTTDLLRARELAKQSQQWRQEHGEVPTLDTTQTIRTLTKSELEDANRPKWFVVQLAISDHPANLDTMPRLDIFEAYSLYSVAVMDGGGIRHALRLGFFREEVSAEAVTGYLKTFFNEPLIVRIPDAEHDRFIDAPKISGGVKSAASVVTLEQKRPVKPTFGTNTVPTVSASVERNSAVSKQAPRSTPAQPAKPMTRAAAPAVKRSAHNNHSLAAKKSASHSAKSANRSVQQELLDEARLLGLSDTAIIRVQKNPSLLSRLVGKLGK